MHRAALLLALAGCSPTTTTVPIPVEPSPAHFDEQSAQISNHLFQLSPGAGASLGLHEFDGKLPDVSADGMTAALAMLRADQAALEAVRATALPPLQRDERDVLLTQIAGQLFDRARLDTLHTNPMSYMGAINLDSYIIRDYAPMADRAAAVIAMCKAVPAYLERARQNLRLPMPRPWIDTALLQTRGLVDFVDHDMRNAYAVIDIPLVNQAEIMPALDLCTRALSEHAAWLAQQQPHGTADFALGAARFIEMLAVDEGVTTDLDRLHAIADADLQRNTAAIEAAAHAIDPNRPVADVVRGLADDRPSAAEVLGVATQQLTQLRAFILAHHIVSIPSDDEALVHLSPPFQRWNAAFMDGPGPFEHKPLPTYYYISPPDPTWPAEDQRTYIPPRADLMFTSVHEIYPGHFIQALHQRKNPSRVLQSFCTYSMTEGWAHYTEEMMFDAGAAGTTPRARIGMLKEALLRNVRFVVALGEHTAGMSVDEATRLFETKAFVDPGNARQQAVRGTFDPMFLAYTLGKLMIRHLHDDWTKQHPDATLGEFHDAFLSHGCAPIPVIRRDLLGDHAGSPI